MGCRVPRQPYTPKKNKKRSYRLWHYWNTMKDKYPITMTGCTGTAIHHSRFYTHFAGKWQTLISHDRKRQSRTKWWMWKSQVRCGSSESKINERPRERQKEKEIHPRSWGNEHNWKEYESSVRQGFGWHFQRLEMRSAAARFSEWYPPTRGVLKRAAAFVVIDRLTVCFFPKTYPLSAKG